uniref:Immunoglobulin like and fibronectin type III domain containing 1, tandem duplicate 3 n=1 Tax=Oncorhynchus kisutch TaxID=8019 RepID=A0A8C7C7F6_ONCKI
MLGQLYRSRVPGVMITQFVEELPVGMTTPDFTLKPIALTIQEGKCAIFKAIVSGNPTPSVHWTRSNGEVTEPERYKIVSDPATPFEHYIEVTDTYKCFATNEYGKAVVTANLNVIESEDTITPGLIYGAKPDDKKEGEIDPRFWDVLMSADKKDYEKICAEFGVTNFRWMLKTLNAKKVEREEEQAKYVEKLSNLKHIEVKPGGGAEFEFEMSLKDPNVKIFLFKNGVMVPFSVETEEKHFLKKTGRKFTFGIKDLAGDDEGLYQVMVEGTNKIPPVKATEREDAVFECVLSSPMSKIQWTGRNQPCEQGEKFDIEVSEDMLIHSLVVKDCAKLDGGIYSVCAGIKSCNAFLVVEGKEMTFQTQKVLLSHSLETKRYQLRRRRKNPGVHFTSGLSDISVNMGNRGELECKLSSENCEGIWYKDGEEVTKAAFSEDGHAIPSQLRYIVATICSVFVLLNVCDMCVPDPPRVNPDDLADFSKPVIIKAGQSATFKLSIMGRDPMKIYWYNEGEELVEDKHINIEKSLTHSRLLLSKCQRKATGEIKIKIKNECGTIEGISRLIVLDRPSPALGPVEIIEASSAVLDFKWRPPKDNGGSPVINYILERQQLGRNSWMKLGQIPGEPKYRDTDVDHGRKYCYHIRAVTEQGISEMMETDDIQAAYPGQPSSPKVISAFANCINLEWVPPSNTGGTNILGYHLEKRKKGSNLWGSINNVKEPIKVKDVIEGIEYEFRVAAINISGAGEPSTPSEFVIARDPKKPPGQINDLKVTDSTYTTLSLGWTKPIEEEGVQDEAKGYFVEIRPAANPEWDRCNNNPIIITSYNILGLKSMAMYWVRVIATNDGGEGEPKGLDNYIIAMPPPVRPHFTDRKMKSFMVVRAGNSARININFVASPMPNITWLKDGMPVSKLVTISNSDNTSQLLISTSERPDTGIYTIIVKNMVGQETFSIEIRVTDDPKPPGPAELEQNVPGTVTVTWTPSPDERRDDRLHYIVSRRDSVKRMWQTVADHLFNNKFTALNIMAGREYYFRVYAKNDMGLSEPSESPTWGVTKKKGTLRLSSPSFLVPLKMHSTPESYECYMSCAVRGDPTPHVTWYRNNISLNTNTNYLITNTCGVCSMLILRVGTKDTGEYKVIADNALGRAECSTKLTVNGIKKK